MPAARISPVGPAGGATTFDERALQLKAIRVLKRVGAGRQLVPSLERQLWMRGENEPLPAIPADLQTVFASLRQLGRKLDGNAPFEFV